MINGRRQPSRGVTSRISREAYVRFCEGLGVKFPGPTRHSRHSRHPGVSGSPQERTFRQSRVYEQARKGVYSQIRFLEAQLSQCPLAQKAECCVAANCASPIKKTRSHGTIAKRAGLAKRPRSAKGLPFSSSRVGRKGRCVTHSITSSARARNDSGIVNRSALAAVRLMTSSNLVGCSTGRSPGFAPRRILST
jgi:hypothetical protein